MLFEYETKKPSIRTADFGCSIQFGASLYSFGIDMLPGALDVEPYLRKISEIGFEGVELVTSEIAPGYPYPEGRWIDDFRGMLEVYRLDPFCYSASMDKGLEMSGEELIACVSNDMDYARRLGFPFVRLQHAVGRDVLERLASLAGEKGIWLGLELKRPNRPGSALWQSTLELLDKAGRGFVGVIPDIGIFMAQPHKLYLKTMERAGARKDVIDALVACHARQMPLEDAIHAAGKLTEQEEILAGDLYRTFTPEPIEGLRQLLPFARYIHGKFYYIGSDGSDHSIPYEPILTCLAKSNYSGYITSEYEGHIFDDTVDPVEQLRRHLLMEKKILGYV